MAEIRLGRVESLNTKFQKKLANTAILLDKEYFITVGGGSVAKATTGAVQGVNVTKGPNETVPTDYIHYIPSTDGVEFLVTSATPLTQANVGSYTTVNATSDGITGDTASSASGNDFEITGILSPDGGESTQVYVKIVSPIITA